MPISPRYLLFTQIGHDSPDCFHMSSELTRKIQRFIAERAHRWLFALRRIAIIDKLRPREINPEAFSHEKNEWARWHEQQCQAESRTT